MSKLDIENARVRFGAYEALKGVSLRADDGQFVTLLGPSGCGKTTLLKAVAGFIPLTSGRIGIGDADMAAVPPERRDTAMCFQSYALFPHLTVAENIVFGFRQRRVADFIGTVNIVPAALLISGLRLLKTGVNRAFGARLRAIPVATVRVGPTFRMQRQPAVIQGHS